MNADDFLNRDLNRRQFLGKSAQNAAGVAVGMAGLAGAAALAQGSFAERLRIAVIGVRNQGKALANGFASLPDATVVTLCDVDDNVLPAAVSAVQVAQGTTPKTERDFRKVLDDPRVDAVVIATPDHWHSRMTTLACEAGKDVYVETPACHFGGEAAVMIAAAGKHQRIVAVGLPQRSGQHFQSAIRLVQSGQLGKVTLAKAWFVQRRQPLTPAVSSDPPTGVDFDSWLGPAPQRSFLANRFHFHWRWFWDHGSGELGAWGSQLLDVARWGLDVEWPQRVCGTRGQRIIADEAETPDSLHVQFDCGDKTVIWEHRTWSNHAPEGRTAAVAFYGERGTLVVDRGGWKVYDSKEPLTSDSSELSLPHLSDFIAAIKERRAPIADLETGAVSAGWGQLAAISHRLGRELLVDPTGQPQTEDALALWRPTSP
ncbi:MAG: Gfo/Idh/MocA family protein [Planctomycetaceae bacterium]